MRCSMAVSKSTSCTSRPLSPYGTIANRVPNIFSAIRRPRYGYDFARFTAAGRNWNDTNRDKQPVRPQSNEQRNHERPAKAGRPWKGKTAHEKGGLREACGSVVGNVDVWGKVEVRRPK